MTTTTSAHTSTRCAVDRSTAFENRGRVAVMVSSAWARNVTMAIRLLVMAAMRVAVSNAAGSVTSCSAPTAWGQATAALAVVMASLKFTLVSNVTRTSLAAAAAVLHLIGTVAASAAWHMATRRGSLAPCVACPSRRQLVVPAAREYVLVASA